jgi:hypothetical protein
MGKGAIKNFILKVNRLFTFSFCQLVDRLRRSASYIVAVRTPCGWDRVRGSSAFQLSFSNRQGAGAFVKGNDKTVLGGFGFY